jgi:hypothetical protein
MTANPLLWLIRELFKACDTRVVLGDTRFTDFSDSPLPEPIRSHFCQFPNFCDTRVTLAPL